MSRLTWNTHQPADPAFDQAWRARLARIPQAHFAFDLAYLRTEANFGRHSLAILADDAPRAGAIVLREVGSSLVSGWPWRWQMVLEGGAPEISEMPAEDAAWLFAQANDEAQGRRLRCFLPARPPGNIPGYPKSTTFVSSLECTEEALLQTLDKEKQRTIRRATTKGYAVVEAADPALYRAFAEIQRDTETRRGNDSQSIPEDPKPGEYWREWELPWMWLLVAVKDGKVEAGSGFGRSPGGTVEYRANASMLDAKKAGVNVLLAWEALRRSRDAGYRRLNWGGATHFKKDLGGTAVEISCWLGGGSAWWPMNWTEVAAQGLRKKVGKAIREQKRPATPPKEAQPKESPPKEAQINDARTLPRGGSRKAT